MPRFLTAETRRNAEIQAGASSPRSSRLSGLQAAAPLFVAPPRWGIHALRLAGICVLIATCALQAEERPSSLLTGFASTSLSGFVDTSAQGNLGTGNTNPPPHKFGGTAKPYEVNLDDA